MAGNDEKEENRKTKGTFRGMDKGRKYPREVKSRTMERGGTWIDSMEQTRVGKGESRGQY